ncbi:MAG: LuxR C-terminal-related transcriptional regulator [Actinobacteria bacterium]|nr:LuxR C-terminal-related transcriptional regulator [Actinomycetota bacterium]MBU4510067.1 LuxR C-terminal-related transcriptional regulator [bacterium]
MRIVKILKKEKILIQIELLIIVVATLFILSGFFVYKHIDNLTRSSEEIYKKTTEGTIEIRLLEEQLNHFETLYTLGLIGKADINKINDVASETITNLATVIKIYPESVYVVNISNSVISMLKIFDDIEKEGFNELELENLTNKIDQIKNDIISFKASNRLKGTNEIKKIENLSKTSNNILFILFISNALLLIFFGIYVARILSKRLRKVSQSLQDLIQIEIDTKEKKQYAEPTWLKEMNEREKEILTLIAQGHTNKEISKKIFIAEQTVKNYVSDIYNKIGLHDRAQVSILAIKAGIGQSKE